MANAPAQSVDQNILPVQAYFNVDGSFNTFIGQGQPFIVSATESIGIIDVNSINATFYPTFSPVSTGQVTSVDVSSSQLTFNPFTGVFSSRNFAGNLNGLALSATNLAGGSTYSIPYQSASGATGFIANGSTGQVLTASAVGAPSWSTPSFSIPITDDTTTNAVRYPLFAAATSGSINTEYTSSTRYQFNPSTGLLTATGFSGSGAALTALNASNLSTGTLPSARVSGSYTSITGVGTITAGTWNGTAIGYAYGGTGLTAAPTNGQLLIGNASGYTLSTLTAGTNITITNAAGGITINSTASGGATITDDTTTNSPRYINFTDATTGSLSTIYTSSTRLSYNPSTGMLTTTGITATAGSINGVTVGATTVAAGSFTTLNSSQNTRIGGLSGNQSLQVNNVASAVNYAQIVGAIAGGAPTLSVQGTDSNISLPIISKGTGAIDLAAGSLGVNISNGGAVTSFVRTGVGTYTSPPIVTISAPTTVGGVQATAVSRMQQAGATIVSGGTGYTVGDLITLAGGTLSGQATRFQVTAVSSGVITAIDVFNLYGDYLTNPANPVSVTGGTGTGATFNVTWYAFALTITNAGSGYVEQPTVSIPAGTSGTTSAYAIVGSQPIIKSIGSSMAFNTPGGTQLVVNDGGGTSTDFIAVVGSTFGRPVIAAKPISGTNVSLGISGTGVGGVLQFMTNNTAQVQAQVNHTASAVNRLDFTGAATGAAPTISAAGSDTNIGLVLTGKGTGVVALGGSTVANSGLQVKPTTSSVNFVQVNGNTAGNGVNLQAEGSDADVALSIRAKGTFNIPFFTGGGTQFLISHTGSSVNYVRATGAATTAAPELAAIGSDANINLKLTPKGTGGVQFTGPLLPNNLAGTSGQVLTSAGAGAVPTWTTASGATITDDTATNAVRYLSFTAATSGSLSTLYTSSTKLKYNPSTGAVTASSIIIAP